MSIWHTTNFVWLSDSRPVEHVILNDKKTQIFAGLQLDLILLLYSVISYDDTPENRDSTTIHFILALIF